MLAAGATQAEIARALGLTKSTVAYHARRVVEPDPKFRRRYDWDEVQAFYDAGHTVSQCQARFGFSRKTFHDACRTGKVTTRPRATPIEALLVVGRVTTRQHLRNRLVAEGLKPAACERCGLTDWRGEPIGLQLHHVNGDGLDNRLDNLEVLCPNCHSQTDTWGARNKRLRRLHDAS